MSAKERERIQRPFIIAMRELGFSWGFIAEDLKKAGWTETNRSTLWRRYQKAAKIR